MRTRKDASIAPVLARHRARPSTRITDRASLEKMAHAVAQSWGPGIVTRVEQQMQKVLIGANLPTEPWVSFPVGAGRHRGLHKLALHEGYGVGSSVWYAAAIVMQIASLRRAQEKNDPEDLLHHALHLGAVLMEANIILTHGSAIDHGLKWHAATAPWLQRKNQTARAAARERHRVWIETAGEVWKRKPAESTIACARAVIRKLGLAPQKLGRVRKVLAPYKPK